MALPVDVTTSAYDWLMFVATAAAASGTIAAVWVALRQVQHERKRALNAERERDKERASIEAERAANRRAARASQALRIVAYPMWVEHDPRKGQGSGNWAVMVENCSEAPVFELRVEGHHSNKVLGPLEKAVLVPGKESYFEVSSLRDRRDRTLLGVVYFRDVAGVRWKREGTGGLVEVDEHRGLIERYL